MSDFSINVKLNGVEQAVSTVGELEEALKETKLELKNLEVGSEAFDKLSTQARNLQRELKDVKEATNFDKNLNQLGESAARLGSSITAGFSGAMAAVSLFGAESEDLTKAQIEAQQALTIALSASTIAMNAAKIAEDARNVGLAIQRGLVAALTAVTGAQTAATVAQTGATVGATVAQRALNAVMAANPVLLLVSAVGLLVGAIALFSGEEEKASHYVENVNDKIDSQTKIIDDNIKKQIELEKIKARINAIGKSDEERLQIETKLQQDLSSLNEDAINNQKKALEEKKRNAEFELELNTTYVKYQMDQQKELQDFNVESRFTAEQKEIASLIRSKEFGTTTTEEYYAQLIEIRKKYFTYTDQEELDAFNKQIKTYEDLVSGIKKLNNDLEVLEADKLAKQKEADEKLLKQQQEAYKKRIQNQEDYNKEVKRLNQERVEDERDIQRQIEDFWLERISLVQGADGVFREDLIAGFDETIAKLQASRDRELEDAKLKYDQDIANFREAQLKKKISKDKIDADVAALDAQFQQSQIDRAKVFNEEIAVIEQDKANQIQEINNSLVNELTFGDNNLSDSRKQLALNSIQFEIDLAQRRIDLERGNNLELIKERQRLQRESIALEEQAALEKLKIDYEQAIKNVQGTETQKGEQRKALTEQYNAQIEQINADFRLREQEAEKTAADETMAYKMQKLEEYSQFATQGASSIVSLLSAINDGARQEETQKINEQYSAEQDALNDKFNAGLISRKEYDKQNAALDARRQKAEYDAKKKAFEQEKKLKIAQAIIAGITGALSAFTGAMQLGPIAGPIVGGILAALVVATTAVQVANISKQKFDGGNVEVSPVNADAGGAVDAGSAAVTNQASSGGFTGFNPTLTGAPQGGTTTTGGGSGGTVKVVVVESDITSAQRRVSVAESNATF